MAERSLAIAASPTRRERKHPGREYVCREWNRRKAFADLAGVLESVANGRRRQPGGRP